MTGKTAPRAQKRAIQQPQPQPQAQQDGEQLDPKIAALIEANGGRWYFTHFSATVKGKGFSGGMEEILKSPFAHVSNPMLDQVRQVITQRGFDQFGTEVGVTINNFSSMGFMTEEEFIGQAIEQPEGE